MNKNVAMRCVCCLWTLANLLNSFAFISWSCWICCGADCLCDTLTSLSIYIIRNGLVWLVAWALLLLANALKLDWVAALDWPNMLVTWGGGVAERGWWNEGEWLKERWAMLGMLLDPLQWVAAGVVRNRCCCWSEMGKCYWNKNSITKYITNYFKLCNWHYRLK